MPTPQHVDPNMVNQQADDGLEWRDLRTLCVEGLGWTDTRAFYDRLPAHAQGRVPDAVWDLSQCSAGIAARFVSDATAISARWRLRYENLAMWHMPSTGVSGIDLYARHEGQWRWAGVSRDIKWPVSSAVLAKEMSPGLRSFMVYLPLYNGVEQVEIGVPRGARLEAATARPANRSRPICFYGTSIVHGGCASRAGMAYPAILGRRLDCPVINLGFSGNGRMEPVMADLLAELDPAAFVIDCLPNMDVVTVEERVAYLGRRLRQSRPDTPIIFVDNINYTDGIFVPGRLLAQQSKNKAQKAAFDRLVKSGVPGLHHVAGDDLIGSDGEGTVDGTHPTDAGFLRFADALEPHLRRLMDA